MSGAWHRCMVGAWYDEVTLGSLGLASIDVAYYLDGGVVGLVMLDFSIGVWFWLRYGVGDIIYIIL